MSAFSLILQSRVSSFWPLVHIQVCSSRIGVWPRLQNIQKLWPAMPRMPFCFSQSHDFAQPMKILICTEWEDPFKMNYLVTGLVTVCVSVMSAMCVSATYRKQSSERQYGNQTLHVNIHANMYERASHDCVIWLFIILIAFHLPKTILPLSYIS